MVLSGTDYNLYSNTSLTETINWFYEYKKYHITQTNNNTKPLEFYVWLVKNTKYVGDFGKLLRTYQLFQIENNNDLKRWDNLVIEPKTQDINKLKKEVLNFALAKGLNIQALQTQETSLEEIFKLLTH
jgi:hypothetical protein